MFSCRTRGFCPSCHSKRLGEWGERFIIPNDGTGQNRCSNDHSASAAKKELLIFSGFFPIVGRNGGEGLTDFAKITLATDYVRPSQRPETQVFLHEPSEIILD
jgi:hypothetical protein